MITPEEVIQAHRYHESAAMSYAMADSQMPSERARVEASKAKAAKLLAEYNAQEGKAYKVKYTYDPADPWKSPAMSLEVSND